MGTIKAASLNNWIDESSAIIELHTAIKRAGADIIISYYAKKNVKYLQIVNSTNTKYLKSNTDYKFFKDYIFI